MTKIVNLRKESYDVYIGRTGKGKDGYFGNPITSGHVCDLCEKTHAESGDTLPCYKAYFEFRIEDDAEFRERVLTLKGKTLGCFCKPKACHGDVIVEWLDEHS